MCRGQFDSSMATIEEYREFIHLKTMDEIEDPVMTKHTGHIYDRADIIEWIRVAGTDPIMRDEILTEDMLVSGTFVKQIYEDGRRKLESQKNTPSYSNEDILKEMREGFKLYDERIANIEKENKEFKEKNLILTAKVNDLTLKNKYLLWAAFGPNIDNKIRKGSAPDRAAALIRYKENFNNAQTEDEIRAAVNDTEELFRMSEPRFFKALTAQSETTRVTKEFRTNVNYSQGW